MNGIKVAFTHFVKRTEGVISIRPDGVKKFHIPTIYLCIYLKMNCIFDKIIGSAVPICWPVFLLFNKKRCVHLDRNLLPRHGW